MEEAEHDRTGRVGAGFFRQRVPYDRRAVGMFGHRFLPGAQKCVAAPGRVPEHAYLVEKIREALHRVPLLDLFCRHGNLERRCGWTCGGGEAAVVEVYASRGEKSRRKGRMEGAFS